MRHTFARRFQRFCHGINNVGHDSQLVPFVVRGQSAYLGHVYILCRLSLATLHRRPGEDDFANRRQRFECRHMPTRSAGETHFTARIHRDLRFRCLERNANFAGNSFRNQPRDFRGGQHFRRASATCSNSRLYVQSQHTHSGMLVPSVQANTRLLAVESALPTQPLDDLALVGSVVKKCPKVITPLNNDTLSLYLSGYDKHESVFLLDGFTHGQVHCGYI